jgi:methionyl-tRNA formyltransferase
MRVGVLSSLTEPLLGYQLRELLNQGIQIDAVLLDSKETSEKDLRLFTERTAGQLPPIPLHQFETHSIPFHFLEDHRSDATVQLVKDLRLDLLVNAGTPRILKSVILHAPRLGIVNCHPGLLPRFQGCTCVEWAIYLDEQVGSTVHFMNESIDAGPIILQEGLFFDPGDTYVDVRVKVYRHANHLLARGVRKVLDQRLAPSTMPAQAPGTYFDVIDGEKMQEVVRKLQEGRYRFQQTNPQQTPVRPF